MKKMLCAQNYEGKCRVSEEGMVFQLEENILTLDTLCKPSNNGDQHCQQQPSTETK